MSFFQNQTFVAVDLETTGINADKDKIIEFAGVLIQDGEVVKQLEFVIDPGIPITPQIQAITGISNAEVAGKPTLSEVKQEIQEFVEGHVVIGHNILFDLNFLEKNGIQTTGQYLDTYTLSSLFFPEEKSLALEVLSENLQIEHKYKHRALGDILATVELLKIIHQKIREISIETLNKVQTFLSAYDTPLQTLFSDVQTVSNEQAQTDLFSFPETEKSSTTGLQPQLNQQLQEVLNSQQNTILEIPHQFHSILSAIELIPKPVTFAFYSPKLLNKILQKISATGKNFSVLKNASNYLCLNKFQKFLQKPKLNDTEITLAIKIMLWLEKSQTGDRDEIALTYDDYPIWYGELCSNDGCSGSEHSECFWQKHKKNCQTSELIFTYQNLLSETALPTQRTLVISEARDLEKSLTNAHSQKIELESFLNLLKQIQFGSELENHKPQIQKITEELQLVWGYLHQELTQDLDEFIYPQKIVFTNTLKTHTGFLGIRKRFKEIFTDLYDLLNLINNLSNQKFRINQLKNLTTDLENFFDEWHENEIRFFQAFPSGELNMQINPIELKSFSTEIFNQYNQVICLDENLATVNGANEYTCDYWKQSLGVETLEWQEKHIALAERAHVDLSFLQEKSSQNIFERTCELIKQTVQKNEGRTLVLFSSYANINLYFEKLGLELQALGYKVLPQGNGGVKKLKAIFKQFPDKSVLFGIERSFHREFFEPQDLKTIILHKLIFDFPGDPLIQARQEKYTNSFMDFSLPRSILSFKQNYLKLTSQEQTFIPLDNRLTTKRYGTYFLETVEIY